MFNKMNLRKNTELKKAIVMIALASKDAEGENEQNLKNALKALTNKNDIEKLIDSILMVEKLVDADTIKAEWPYGDSIMDLVDIMIELKSKNKKDDEESLFYNID